ncbi:MAG TPA: hypothetical protein VFD58_32085 [Blastocatellia bacterium]|nr:hypothetical protein [Blastocatellia bacterium]
MYEVDRKQNEIDSLRSERNQLWQRVSQTSDERSAAERRLREYRQELAAIEQRLAQSFATSGSLDELTGLQIRQPALTRIIADFEKHVESLKQQARAVSERQAENSRKLNELEDVKPSPPVVRPPAPPPRPRTGYNDWQELCQKAVNLPATYESALQGMRQSTSFATHHMQQEVSDAYRILSGLSAPVDRVSGILKSSFISKLTAEGLATLGDSFTAIRDAGQNCLATASKLSDQWMGAPLAQRHANTARDGIALLLRQCDEMAVILNAGRLAEILSEMAKTEAV